MAAFNAAHKEYGGDEAKAFATAWAAANKHIFVESHRYRGGQSGQERGDDRRSIRGHGCFEPSEQADRRIAKLCDHAGPGHGHPQRRGKKNDVAAGKVNQTAVGNPVDESPVHENLKNARHESKLEEIG
ncbi:MAG: hypothetical protein ACLQVJ_08690 [Syntrophobacteraceae bacterium]